MTNSELAPPVRRMVPVHATDAGKVAGQPAPLTIVPAQLPYNGSPAAWLTDDGLARDGQRRGARVAGIFRHGDVDGAVAGLTGRGGDGDE